MTFTTLLVHHRDDILKEYNEYEEISVFPNEAGLGSGSDLLGKQSNNHNQSQNNSIINNNSSNNGNSHSHSGGPVSASADL